MYPSIVFQVVDVYTEWSGPCFAVESHLRRLRHSFVEAPDTLALARACCDQIEDLQPFKQYVLQIISYINVCLQFLKYFMLK